MFDIANPLWGYTPDEICKYKIEHIEDPFLLQIASKTEWAEAYANGCLPFNA
jgi:hypothetical protein